MTQDNTEVQAKPEEVKPSVVSIEGTTLEKPPEVPKVETPSQPLTEERIQQLIAEATLKAVEQGREKGRREMQSEQDIRVRDAIREANRLKRELADRDASLAGLDDETKQGIELARYRAGEKGRQEIAREELQKKQDEETLNSFKSSLSEHATDLGIDLSDKRLDFGIDYDENGKMVNFTDRNRNFLKSVAKVQKDNKKAEEQALERRLKALETKADVDTGVYSHDAGTSAGRGTDDEAFMKSLLDPNHVTTKEDLRKINEIKRKRGG